MGKLPDPWREWPPSAQHIAGYTLSGWQPSSNSLGYNGAFGLRAGCLSVSGIPRV